MMCAPLPRQWGTRPTLCLAHQHSRHIAVQCCTFLKISPWINLHTCLHASHCSWSITTSVSQNLLSSDVFVFFEVNVSHWAEEKFGVMCKRTCQTMDLGPGACALRRLSKIILSSFDYLGTEDGQPLDQSPTGRNGKLGFKSLKLALFSHSSTKRLKLKGSTLIHVGVCVFTSQSTGVAFLALLWLRTPSSPNRHPPSRKSTGSRNSPASQNSPGSRKLPES